MTAPSSPLSADLRERLQADVARALFVAANVRPEFPDAAPWERVWDGKPDGEEGRIHYGKLAVAAVDAIVRELVAAGWRDLHAVRDSDQAQADMGQTQ